MAALALTVGCGGSPTAPSFPATPPPPVYPTMTGGWGGTWTQVYNSGGQNANLVCSAVWIITSQTNEQFFGTVQWSGDTGCPGAAQLVGNVLPNGEVHVSPRGSSPGLCILTGGDSDYHGFVSPSGGLTAQQSYRTHCEGEQYGRGIDYTVVATFVVNRR